MALDPQAKQFLDWLNNQPRASLADIGPVAARELYHQRPKAWSPPFVEMVKVTNQQIVSEGLSIPVRIYRPIETETLLPVLVFYHGGGMVIGSLDGYDTLCRQLAHQSGYIVISVDYRLAPEHKFPAAVDDAWAALTWVINHGDSIGVDKTKIVVGGDSAGGTLAAVVALQARDHRLVTLAGQLLIYPAVAPKPDYPSQMELAEGYFLERSTILWFHQCYQNSEKESDDYRYGPLVAESHSNLPPAYVLTAGYDPLKDEGRAYAERLQQAGVSVQHDHYPGMFHPFISLAGIMDKGMEAISNICDFMKNVNGQ